MSESGQYLELESIGRSSSISSREEGGLIPAAVASSLSSTTITTTANSSSSSSSSISSSIHPHSALPSGSSRKYSYAAPTAYEEEEDEDLKRSSSPLASTLSSRKKSVQDHELLLHTHNEFNHERKESDQLIQGYDDVIVKAVNIHKTYLLGIEGVPALRGVNLQIKRGEFVMILGSSGGGKTSLLNCLGTIDKPTKGELYICGQRITSNTKDEEFAMIRLRRIGFVFQTFNLIPSMTAEENVALPMILDGRRSKEEIKKRARELLTRVGLSHRFDHLPSQLSGGEQQRVTIARAIANRPQILLMDEPTGDLDTINGTIILSLLMHLNRVEGITCIMVTHDQLLKNYAHRVVHMLDGKINRIEEISESVRKNMDNELEKKVKIIRGEASGEISTDHLPKIEYRDAHDYADYLLHEE